MVKHNETCKLKRPGCKCNTCKNDVGACCIRSWGLKCIINDCLLYEREEGKEEVKEEPVEEMEEDDDCTLLR